MKTIKKVFLILLISTISVGCQGSQKSNLNTNTDGNDIQTSSELKSDSIVQTKTGEVHIITPAEFKEKSVNHSIVDIRTPFEFKRGYIKGAENINYYNRDFLEQMSKFDKNEPIYIYCRSGNRTSSASRKLSKLGFKEIYDLRGGILNWERSKNQIEK